MKKDGKCGVKLFTRAYIFLILISLMTAMSYSMISTLITNYAVELGGTLAMAGTIAGIFSMAALFSRPVGGVVCDTLDKKKICMAATIVFTLSFPGYALSRNMAALLFFRMLQGFAFGISGTANMALVAEVVPKKRLGEGLGYFGLGQVVSQVIGPIAGVAMKERLGFEKLFYFVTGISAIAVFLLLLFRYNKQTGSGIPEEAERKSGKMADALTLRRLVAVECLVYALTAGMFSMANGVTSSFLVLLGEERGIANIALFFTVNAVCLFFIRILMGKIADRASVLWIVGISLAVSLLSMTLLAKAFVLKAVLLAALFKAIGQGGGQISLQSACIKAVDESRVGVASSTYYIGADIGNALGPAIGGWISGLWGYEVMFHAVAVLMGMMLVFFWCYERRMKRMEGMRRTEGENGSSQV